MLKYRLLLASMLIIAFLNSGLAQEPGEIPAELEVSLDRAVQQGLGYHLSGTIPLQLPDRDDVFFFKTTMRAYWHLTPVLRECRSNVAFITLRVAGRRNHDQLALSLVLTPKALRPACSDDASVERTSALLINTGNLNSTEFRLFVADGSNDERTTEDSSHLGKLTGKVTLHLACPVSLLASETVPTISVLPTDTNPWPLRFDDSKASAVLSALVASPSAVIGMTRPSKPYPPIAFFRDASRRSSLRSGFCYWIRSIDVEFTPVEVFLANKYLAGSCEYKVIREHEMLHYQDLQILLTRYQALVMVALRHAGLPTMERPVFVESALEGTSHSKTRLQGILQPIYASMEKAIQSDADARDAPEQRVLSWSQCQNWNPTVTRQATMR